MGKHASAQASGQVMSTPPSSMLICRAGPHTLALHLADVIETMRPLPSQPVLGVPSYVRGVSLIRGEAVPVIDARTLLGDSGAPARPEPSRATAETRVGRFVTLQLQDRTVALAVDEVVELRDVDAETVAALPPLLAEAGSGAVNAMGRLDDGLLLVLGQARLVPEEAWQVLAEAAATDDADEPSGTTPAEQVTSS